MGRTDTVRLIAGPRRLGRRRAATALLAALALPAIVALGFFAVDASTSRAALDRKQVALGLGPPSEPKRNDAPARGDEPPQLDPRQGSDDLSASAVVEPGPAPNISAVPDPSAAPDPSANPLLSAVPRYRVSPASDPVVSPAAPRRSESPRTPRAPSATRSSPARLTITASAPSEVLLDGLPLGPAPVEGVGVEPGLHEVTFIHNGKRTVETLTIRSGEHKRVEARIAPAPGDGLDEAAVKRTIKSNRSAVIDTCWDHAFGTRAPGDPTSIRVPVTMTVEPSGLVRSVVTEAEPSGYPELRHCIEKRVSAWRFPSARADTVVSVAFVFVLK